MPDQNPLGDLDKLVGRLLGGLGGAFDEDPGSREPRERAASRRLDRHGDDLTARARAGGLDPVVGRDREIAQVLEVLCRRTKNNPVLVGDPGVGKTAIVEGIASRVAADRVPPALRGRRVVSVDLAGMVSGTKYRGEFEERLGEVIAEVTAADGMIVLFVDELHQVIGAGSGADGGTMDAATILKPALARGTLRLIGATTAEEYRRHVESDPALERRFAAVTVAEPTVEATVTILDALAPRYEAHHTVRLPSETRRAAAALTHRHVRDRFLPDKAIDALDRAAARVRMRAAEPGDEGRLGQLRRARAVAVDAEDYERAQALQAEIDAASVPDGVPTVTATDVAAVVADTTGVPVTALADLSGDDRGRLLDLDARLRRRVIGQDAAVEAVTDAVLAGRAGLADPGRPVGSFLFAGPTGVGKTELARALAEALHGTDDALVRLDMAEFAEAHTVSRLTGAPPGYVGHDRAGELTEPVRRRPSCVVLLDEIEKAHADVVAVLLGILDAGRLTDARGRTVSFTDAVVILTSNLGAAELTVAGGDPEAHRDGVTATLRRALRPELLARVDDVVLFGPLSGAALRGIVELALGATRERLAAQGVGLSVSPAALEHLAAKGTGADGARGLRRVVRRDVERPLSRLLVGGGLGAGGHVTLDVDGSGGVSLRP